MEQEISNRERETANEKNREVYSRRDGGKERQKEKETDDRLTESESGRT